MPGIVGIAWNEEIDENLFGDMLSSIKHKDFQKIDKFSDSYAEIGRVHIGIFNPEKQPIFNEDKSLCIFMDGKIYDYDKELEDLKQKGHKLNLDNDPEFCLHLYEAIGTDFVKDLNGQFVIVIYDINEKKIVIVNDRYGLRPMYINFKNINNFFDDVNLDNGKKIENINKLLFASEVKAILKDKEFKKELNDCAVAEFFAFGHLLGDKTFFKDIEVLPSASILTYKNNEISIERYWEFKHVEDPLFSEEKAVEDMVKTFKKAVSIRMKENLKYGVELSGGLDSRSVIAAMDDIKRKEVRTFTYKMKEGVGESEIAEMVARKAGTKHKTIEYDADTTAKYAEEIVYLSDGMNTPFVSFGIYAGEKIRKYANVVFSGFALEPLVGGVLFNSQSLKAKNIDDLFNKIYAKKCFFSNEELSNLFTKKYYNKIKNVPMNSLKKELKHFKFEEQGPGNIVDCFYNNNYTRKYVILGLSPSRNYVEDPITTYDNDFVDVVLKIPAEMRLNRKIHIKFLNRLSPELTRIPYNKTRIRADVSLLPLLPLLKEKTRYWLFYLTHKFKEETYKIFNFEFLKPENYGYVDFELWLRENEKWRNFVRTILLDEKTLSRGYFNKEYIKKLITGHERREKNNSREIIWLVTFELFLRMFVDA